MRHNNFRRSRKLRVALWGEARDVANKRSSPCGQHAGKSSSSRKISAFSMQLGERQKLMAFYGLKTERDLRIVATNALKSKGNTIDNLISRLEVRLASILFRSGIVPTIFSARQLISHKHVMVNGKIVNRSGYALCVEDEVEIVQSMKMHQHIVNSLETKRLSGLAVPEYLDVNAEKRIVKLTSIPTFADVNFPCIVQPQYLVVYYSNRV